MADVKLPLVGGVSKKALLIGGVASAAVIGFLVIRKRSSAAAPAAAADTTAADTTGLDTSGDYTSPGLQDTSMGPTAGAGGYYDPNSGQWVYGSTGTGQAAATTNQQWAQLAEQYLTANAGADPGALSAALGAYLAGHAVTAAQEGLIDQAVAVEGWPPVAAAGGYPPGIRTQASPGQGGKTAVPNVSGLTMTQAKQVLTSAGFKISGTPPDVKGYHHVVTGTTPKAGTQAAHGSTVHVTTKKVKG